MITSTSAACRVGLLLEERAPPDHDTDVARPRRRRPVDEVHALPVWRHVVLRAPVSRSDERHAQRVGDTESQLSSRLELDRPAMKTAFTIDVEKLLPIAAPDGLAAAVAGHHETPRWARHRADGDDRSASLLRNVGEPLSVRRYPRVVLGERPGKDRLGRTRRPRATRSTRRPAPIVAGRVLTMRERPSGDQSVGSQYASGHGSSCITPVPSAAAMLNRRSLKLPDPYANRRPSGDHTGRIDRNRWPW